MSISEQRKAIILEIGDLERRGEKGEKVDTRIRHCGKRLEALGRNKKRRDVLDATEDRSEQKKNLYVTIDEGMYKRAESIGVDRHTLRQRIHRDGWDVEVATAKPKGRRLPSDVGDMTVAQYTQLKEEGVRDVDICEKYEIKRYVLHRFKQKHGISDKRVKVAVK